MLGNLKGCDVEASSSVVDRGLEDCSCEGGCCGSRDGFPDGELDGFAKSNLGNLSGVNDGVVD